jgi:hypothetical protein
MQRLRRTNYPNQCISTVPGSNDIFLTHCNTASNWDTQEFVETGRLKSEDSRCATTLGLGFGDPLQMRDCADIDAQKFYLSRDGNLRAKETVNSMHPGKKVFDDGCIGPDVYGTLITDRSGFGRNYRNYNSAGPNDNSRICSSKFAFDKMVVPQLIIPCDETIHGVDISNECDYKTGKWITNDGYPLRENYAPPGELPKTWPIRNCPVAGHPTKKCIEVVSGKSLKPQQKIVCKQNYHGQDCDLYLADDTIEFPIAWNSEKSRDDIIKDMIKIKCERGYDEKNNKAYCDQILPGSWNKIGRDINREIVNDAKMRYSRWLKK